MKIFMRLALSLFALAIIVFVFAYVFNPGVRSNLHSGDQPVGQLPTNLDIQSAGQPEPLGNDEALDTNQGTTLPAESAE